ncbi:MAG: MlaD family protein [Planctomycetota bacterium]|jgi:ABC-type transporter Mla subunit MlaD
MARKTRNEVAVGMTVLIVLALVTYIVIMLADWSSLLTPQQKITVKVPYRVGLRGLISGSPVHLGGIKIGRVTDTWISKLDQTNESAGDIYVFFTMKISEKYQLLSDCVLVPQSNVFGGQALLSIEDLGRDGEVIRDGQTVDLLLADSAMEAIKQEFNPDDPNSLLARIKYEVDRDKADSIVTSVKDAIAQLEKDINDVAKKLQQTLDKAESALHSAQSTLEDIKEVAGDERLDRIVGNLTEVSVNLKLTSREVRRAPWKLLYKPKRKEFRIQALVDSAGAFAAGAERLDSAALRLQKLLAVKEDKQLSDKDQIKSMLAELETSFEQFRKAERKFWDELK